MKTRSSLLPVALVVILLGCAGSTLDLEAEKAALLKTVDAEVGDLLAADTAALRAEIRERDTVYNVSNGQVFRTTHANALEGYDFATLRYTGVAVLDSSIVHVSPDGRMAWIVFRYRFTYLRKDSAGVDHRGELIDAGLTVYEKKDSRWVGTALAQTFPPAKK